MTLALNFIIIIIIIIIIIFVTHPGWLLRVISVRSSCSGAEFQANSDIFWVKSGLVRAIQEVWLGSAGIGCRFPEGLCDFVIHTHLF